MTELAHQVGGDHYRKMAIQPRMTDDEYEALEERSAIIQFCSGREVSRADAWRMACEQAAQQAAKVIKAQQELARRA